MKQSSPIGKRINLVLAIFAERQHQFAQYVHRHWHTFTSMLYQLLIQKRYSLAGCMRTPLPLTQSIYRVGTIAATQVDHLIRPEEHSISWIAENTKKRKQLFRSPNESTFVTVLEFTIALKHRPNVRPRWNCINGWCVSRSYTHRDDSIRRIEQKKKIEDATQSNGCPLRLENHDHGTISNPKNEEQRCMMAFACRWLATAVQASNGTTGIITIMNEWRPPKWSE